MSEFTSWEQMSDLEQAQTIFWDMYKDAHGVRPHCIDTSTWTLEDFQAEFAMLQVVIVREEAQRKVAESEAVVKFEKHVTDIIGIGACDRETALRWIMDASDFPGDWEHLCYVLGLPYQYFRKVA
jgi:hypothetical protein